MKRIRVEEIYSNVQERVFNDPECEKDFVNSLFHTPIIPYMSKVSSLESCLVFLKHLHVCCLSYQFIIVLPLLQTHLFLKDA